MSCYIYTRENILRNVKFALDHFAETSNDHLMPIGSLCTHLGNEINEQKNTTSQ